MKKVLPVLVVLCLMLACKNPDTTVACLPKADSLFWTDDKANAHLADMDNPATWDTAMLHADIDFVDFKHNLPFNLGAYPTPDYDRVGKGSFKGIGSYGLTKYINGKSIAIVSFAVNASVVNMPYIKVGKKNEVYFTLAVLTDKADTVDYTHTMNSVVSRNHPDYVGEGYVNTSIQRIDYAAFLTANRNSYALINMRLFDLKNGALVLIAPHKDKSLRSLQLVTPGLSADDVELYIDSLLKQPKIASFFTEKGTI